MTENFLPYGRQSIDDADIAAVAAVLRSDWLTTGPAVANFETALAAAVGASHAVSCSSGTAALHLALLATKIGPGDRVVVPAITFAATANVVRLVGARPVFADVNPSTGIMEPHHVETAIAQSGGQPIKAIIPVHFAGQCADPGNLASLAAQVGAIVIEDACHALGSRYVGEDGRTVRTGACAHSTLACFSFHPVKTIAMGEGGAVTTNDPALAALVAEFRNHGITRDPSRFTESALAFASDDTANPWYYEVQSVGFNYRASDLHCALGTSQLSRLEKFVSHRRRLVDHYENRLSGIDPLIRTLDRYPGHPAWHLMVSLIDFEAAGRERSAVAKALREAGIGTQVHYIPLPWQPAYRDAIIGRSFPGAAAYYARALSLPLFASMTPADVDRVVDTLASAVLGQ